MYYNRCMVYRLQIIIIMTTKNEPPPRVVRKTDDRDGAENDAPPPRKEGRSVVAPHSSRVFDASRNGVVRSASRQVNIWRVCTSKTKSALSPESLYAYYLNIMYYNAYCHATTRTPSECNNRPRPLLCCIS